MKGKKNTVRVVWFFLKGHKLHFLFLITIAVLIGFLESLNVALMYPILTNTLGTGGANQNIFLSFLDVFAKIVPVNDMFIAYCVLFVLLALTVFIGKIFYFYYSEWLTAKIVINTKENIFDKCMNSDYQFFVDNKQGEILYKTQVAPSSIATLLNLLSSVTIELFLSISIFALLFSMSWKGTILLLIGGFGYYSFTKYLSHRISYISGKKKLESGQTETVVINEYTTGAKQIKVFNTFPYWKKQYDKALQTFWKYHRKGVFWARLPEVLLIFLLYVSVGAVVLFLRIQNPTGFSDIIPVLGTMAFAMFMVTPKISNFGRYRMQFMEILPNVEAVHAMLKDKKYNILKNGKEKFTGLKTGIKMQNVKFAHKERADIISDVSLNIEKNKVTALVGPSGSGKSTIVNLLLRLYDADSGSVKIDKKNIKELEINTFLNKIGFVSQETFIYNASIKENIAFGGNYSDEEIIEAAKLANIHDFIDDLPDKYDTIVGDRGTRLSGGEKQRIAIARAMIRKPEILMLDEATSSLDNISENLVQRAINNVSKNCTTFVIAHRLSTIKDADMIYVIDDGGIVENGDHNQLLNKKGKYWELNNIQNNPDK